MFFILYVTEGLCFQCFGRVYAGIGAQGEAVTDEGYGRDDEQMVTLKLNLDSSQVSPQWTDPPKVLALGGGFELVGWMEEFKTIVPAFQSYSLNELFVMFQIIQCKRVILTSF